MKTLTAALILSVGLVGCAADDSGSMEIADTQLAGTVGGKPWSFQTGHTSAFLSEGDPDFFSTLYPMAFTTCGFSEPGGDHLIVAVPKTTGEYEMGLSRNMTFVVGESQNLIAFEGKIVIDEVTATTVKGGLAARYDDANSVSGRFELAICPD